MATSNFKVKNGVEVTEVLYVSGACSLRNVGILGPVDPDVAGITVHGDISASGTIFVAGSAVGGSSSSSLASGAGGALNELQYNNSGILDGAEGLIYQESDGFLGLGIANAQERLTVSGNISGAGFINIGSVVVAGKVDGRDVAGDAANVVAASATWDSAYSTLKANSAEYESTFSTLKPNSGGWTDTESTVRANSGTWTAGASLTFKTIALSGNRSSATIGADIVADSTTDTLTLCAGPNIVLLSDPTNDVITISGSAGNSATIYEDLTVSGNISASGSLSATSLSANYFAGNVGIGTNVPDYALDVAGDIGIDQYIYHNGDADTFIRFGTNAQTYKAGGLSFLNLEKKGSAPHEVTINDGSNNIDFVVKGNGSNEGNPLFKTDASTGRVGINGVGDPEVELEVDGTIAATGSDPRIGIGTIAPNEALTVVGNISASGNLSAANLTVTGNISSNGTITAEDGDIKDYLKVGRLTVNNPGLGSNDFRVEGTETQYLLFADANQNNVGIGTSAAKEELTVAGNISASGTLSANKVFAADGLYHTGDGDDTFLKFPTGDKVQINAGGVNMIYAWQKDADVNKLIFNDDNTDTDIVFRGAVGSNNKLLYLDASEDNVGIGTGFPEEKLTVAGNISANGDVFAKSVIVDGDTLYFRSANGTVNKETGPKISTTQGGSVVIQASTTSGAAGTVVVITSAGTVASVTSGEETRVEIGGYPSSFTTSLSTVATVFASGGNSKDWNSTYTTVNTLTTTAGTAVANKMLIVDGSKDIDLDGGDLTATDITVQGDLTVQGATFQADTIVTVTSALSVTNTGTGPALTVDQEGNNTIVDFRDDGAPVFTIANGGNITIKDSATFDGRDVSADGAVLDRHKLDVANIAAVSANWTTAYNNSLLTRPELAEVASTSANWNTSYTTSTDTVTIHSDVSNAGSGAIITDLERSRFTANWTDTNAASGSWNSTNTTVKSNSGLLDVTAGTVAASKALVVDSNKDIATLRNVTTNGQLIAGQLRVTTTTAPSSYTYSGTKGDIAYDTNYVYICVANNSWRRSPLAIW